MEEGEGNLCHRLTRLVYTMLTPGIFIQPTSFLEMICRLLEIIKARIYLLLKYLETVQLVKVIEKITIGVTVVIK